MSNVTLHWMSASLLCVLFFGSGVCRSESQATAQSPASTALREQLLQIVSQHHGKVAVFAENLRTGETVGIDADKPVQTASVIKLTILFDAMEQVRAGTVRLDEPIILHKQDQVGGSGVLQLFDTPLTLTLHDVLALMITQSDNTATNLAIGKLGLDNINAETQRIGLKDTWLYKKISKPSTAPMPADQKIYGLGKTTPREMASLLSRIYRCQFSGATQRPAVADDTLCTDMLTLLRKQFWRDGLPRYLEAKDSAQADAAMGNKTGSLDAVRNDVGLVSTKAGPIVLSIFTYDNVDHGWSVDNEGELTIAKLSKAIIDAWSPEGLDPADYKPTPNSVSAPRN
jgi:beta-lactamase class A